MLITGLLVSVGILNAAMAVLVLTRNIRKPLNIWFFLMVLATAAWVLGIAAFMQAESVADALSWARFYYIAPLLIGLSSVAFADVFPSGAALRRGKVLALTAGFLLLAIPIAFNPDFLFQGLVYHEWGKEVLLNRTVYGFYAIYLSVAFLLTLTSAYRSAHIEKGLYNAQAITFFYGYFVSCILGVYFNLILPGLGNYQLIWLGPLASSAYALATAYGIVRHRMFDIRLIIARTLGYLAAVLALSFLYGFVIFGLGQWLFDVQVDLKAQVFFSAATGIVALSFQRVRAFFDRATNHIFYRDAYDAQVLFDEYNKALVSTIDLNELLHRISLIIVKHLKAEYCLVGVKDGSDKGYRVIGTIERQFAVADIMAVRKITPRLHRSVVVADDLPPEYDKLQGLMARNRIAVLARLTPNVRSRQEGLGYIILGSKKSGNLYNSQDIKAIEVMANELIIAIQNAMHYEEIQTFNETLQQKVADATRRLKVSNEKLKQLNDTKDDFIGMASHQLRTPLTSVKGYLSLVLEEDAGKINDMQKKMLTQAFVSSQRMVYLIADLLNVSRLKTGRFILERTPTNIATMIGDEIGQLREVAAARGVDLTFEAPDKFPFLPLDETKTRQVVMNFLDNAIYYTPAGGHVKVELRNLPQSVELRVIDDGIGVPKTEQYHMFTKFYRAKNAQRTRPDGTGLGLFMAKKVIVAQGGAIIFDSVEGEGSTFGFSFPKDLPAASGTPETIPAS